MLLQQRQPVQKRQRALADTLLAALNLLLSVPTLLFLCLGVFHPHNLPTHLLDWLIYLPLSLVTLGLFLSGVLLCRRQRDLARFFQWLAGLAGLLLALGIAYNQLQHPTKDPVILLCFLASLFLMTLPVLLYSKPMPKNKAR